MLSDSLFDMYHLLLQKIHWYSQPPFEPDYPLAQKENIINALKNILLAQRKYDSFVEADDEDDTNEQVSEAYNTARRDFYLAIGIVDYYSSDEEEGDEIKQ